MNFLGDYFLGEFLWKCLVFRWPVAFDESVGSVVLCLRVAQGLQDDPLQDMLSGYFQGHFCGDSHLPCTIQCGYHLGELPGKDPAILLASGDLTS